MERIAIDVKEIHGYLAELGLRVFTDAVLGRQKTGTALGGMKAHPLAGQKTNSRSTKSMKKHER